MKHHIDFLNGVQHSLNAETLRILSIRESLEHICRNFQISQTVRIEMLTQIKLLRGSEKDLRQQYSDIETYKNEYWKAQLTKKGEK